MHDNDEQYRFRRPVQFLRDKILYKDPHSEYPGNPPYIKDDLQQVIMIKNKILSYYKDHQRCSL